MREVAILLKAFILVLVILGVLAAVADRPKLRLLLVLEARFRM